MGDELNIVIAQVPDLTKHYGCCEQSLNEMSVYFQPVFCNDAFLIKSAEFLCEFSTGKTEWGVGQKGLRGRQRVADYWSGRSIG
jgi:hypothetical protein